MFPGIDSEEQLALLRRQVKCAKRPERDRSTISASGGQGDGVVWVTRLQRVAHVGRARLGPPQLCTLGGRSPRRCGRKVPPVGGSKGPEPLASPNVLHWVGWLPGTTRCAAGPAVPASHGAPCERGACGGADGRDRIATTPRSRTVERFTVGAGHSGFPTGGEDGRSLRGESVQAASRGVLVCHGVRKSSLPGKARGFRVQDTVESHGGLDVVMEKINQSEPERPTSNGREMIDDFRLRGSRTCRGMDAPLRNEGWRVGVAHEVARPFNNPNAPLSEGEVLPVVVQVVPGNPHWTRVGTDCPNPMG